MIEHTFVYPESYIGIIPVMLLYAYEVSVVLKPAARYRLSYVGLAANIDAF